MPSQITGGTPPMSPDQYVDTDGAAKFYDVTPGYLKKLRLTGNGPRFTRLAERAIRYRVSDLIAWAEQRAATSTAQYGEAA
jgi:hypothetical protein